jgi:hypothetical protein
VDLQAKAEVSYTRFVSVSIDPPETQPRSGLGSVPDGRSVRHAALVDRSARPDEATDTTHRPYLPMVFTLRPDLTIHRVYDGYWFWGRPTSKELRQDFRAIGHAIRPEWEPPRP